VRLRPDAFAAVMATGIVSTAAEDHGYRLISAALAALGAIALAALVITALTTRPRWDYHDPDVTLRLFTFVAACAMLASRLAARHPLLWMLGGVAGFAWLVLFGLSAANFMKRTWVALRDQAHGAWELASVATSGLAIVGADATMLTRSAALLAASAALWLLAVMLYCVTTTLTLSAARRGATFQPDHWILMGGLAIATLAGALLHAAADAVSSPLAPGMPPVTAVTWALATAWIPILLAAQLRHLAGPADSYWAGVPAGHVRGCHAGNSAGHRVAGAGHRVVGVFLDRADGMVRGGARQRHEHSQRRHPLGWRGAASRVVRLPAPDQR
jgi:Voltage-dependent anion channel